MGKRIIQQRRGRGTSTYRVKKSAFKHKVRYPNKSGKAKVMKLITSGAHTAPLAKIKVDDELFFNLASKNMYEGQEIFVGGDKIEIGNVIALKDVPLGTSVFNIEVFPGDGGKLIRTGGSSALISKKQEGKVGIMLPSKKEKWFHENCRVTIGAAAGHGRLEKPILKAGKKYYIKKAKSKLWPRTSAVAMNAIDHPFGSGRGKNVSHGNKGKTPKRNSPPGAKVGSIRPSRSGRRKR